MVGDKGYHSNATMTGVKKPGTANLCERAEPGPPEMEGQAGRAEGRLRQPPPHPGASGGNGAVRVFGMRLPTPDSIAWSAFARPTMDRSSVVVSEN